MSAKQDARKCAEVKPASDCLIRDGEDLSCLSAGDKRFAHRQIRSVQRNTPFEKEFLDSNGGITKPKVTIVKLAEANHLRLPYPQANVGFG